MAQLSILVVDDDPDVCAYVGDLLAHDGYHVETVNDPTKAVDAFRRGEFHIVVLDLMMPKLPGIELLPQLRKTDDDVAIVVLTGYPSLDTAMASIGHDVAAYIRKPFSMDEFRSVITKVAKKKGLALRREDELHQTIGRSIREARRGRALTLKQLARRTKLSVSLLSQIERAESSASVSSLFKIASALDVKLSALLGKF